MAVLVFGDVTRFGNLWRDLRGGQHTALPRFRALGQLQFDHLHLIVRSQRRELLGVEAAIMGAAAEVACADLENQIAATFAVITADPALARVMREPADLRALVQRGNGVGRQRTKAHGRDVVDRRGVRLRTIITTDQNAEIGVRDLLGFDRVRHPLIAGIVDALLRAKRPLVLDVLGALIHDRPRFAAERHLFVVAFDQILADLGADGFEQVAEVTDDGIVAQHRVPRLEHVIDAHQHEDPAERPDRVGPIVPDGERETDDGNHDSDRKYQITGQHSGLLYAFSSGSEATNSLTRSALSLAQVRSRLIRLFSNPMRALPPILRAARRQSVSSAPNAQTAQST